MLPPGFEPRSSDRKSEMIGYPQRTTTYDGFSSDRTTPREQMGPARFELATSGWPREFLDF